MKAVILARVSTTRQEKEGLSLQDIQLPILQEYAQERGFEVVENFVFSESADQKIRKKFEEMVNFVKKRKDVKYVIAYRVDRVTRNFRDAVLIDELMRTYDKEIHFVDDRLVINKDTVGRDMQDWDLKVFLAKQHLNRLKEDAKSSAKFKLKRGEWCGKAPFGYDNIVLETKKKWIEPNPFEANIVKFLFETYATGTVSFLSLSHKLKKELGYSMTTSQIDLVLNRKFYAGIMQYNGEEYKHNYERIISMSLYEDVQIMKNLNGQRGKGIKNGKLPFLYRGLIKCAECGSSITPERKKNKYHYYRCTQHYKKHDFEYVSEENVTKQIEEIFGLVHLTKPRLERLLEIIRESHEGKKQLNRELLSSYQGEYARLDTNISKAYDYLFKGSIPEEVCNKKVEEYTARQAKLRVQIEQLKEADEGYYKNIEVLLKIVTNSGHLFKSSELDEKREVLKLAFQNLTLKGSKLIYKWNPTFEKVSYCVDHPEWHARQDLNL